MPVTVTTKELRQKFLDFFTSKGHVVIPSAPLVPEHDPSVLFTTAGMHPLVPYLKGQPHPGGRRLADAQKCLRTTDIDEVGDATHATVFEMLGNWSLGDYFKKEAIAWSWEFLTDTKWLGLDPNYLAVTVFAGDASAPRDEEAAALWKAQGVPDERIAYLGADDNWWPSGGGQPGPQGPDTEMFYWTGKEEPPVTFDPSNKRWVEIWNDVFMQFDMPAGGALQPLKQQNVDTGMGLERGVMVLNGHASIYEIDSFQEVMEYIRSQATSYDERHARIVADHMKAAAFLLADEHPIEPSNTDQGYVLRRLIRRAVRSARVLGIGDIPMFLDTAMGLMFDEYQDYYTSLARQRRQAAANLKQEVERFLSALSRGMKEFTKAAEGKMTGDMIRGQDAFTLYESFGFPIELTQELARERGLTVEMGSFEEALAHHQIKSREATKGKFAGGLADHSEMSVKYHTATHLLHQALRTVLGSHVLQKGSNITPERLRFDFSHPQKMTAQEIQKVEDLVNEQIQRDLKVIREEMTVEQAKDKGALGLFEHKYGEKVSVYTMGDFSCEICGGPHVEHTGTLGKFTIDKEESASSGVRRIKATLV
jgi:alanyl-tRNA synthetase